MRRFLILLVFALIAAGPAPQAPDAIRVGGDYKVTSVDKIDDHTFRVQFQSVKPTGRYDQLRLDSDHVHVAVKVGQEIRLSAEILSEDKHGASAEVAQMVLFLPS